MSLAGGLASSIVSGIKGERATAASRAQYEENKSLLSNIFNKQYYSDITQRTDIQNMMRLMNENQEKQAKRDNALAAITGATPEAQLAAQESRNKSYADALAEIASNASTLKDTYLQNYLNQRLQLVDPSAQIAMNQANQWGQAGSNLFSSGASLFASGLGQTAGGTNTPANSSTQPSYWNAFGAKPV